VKFNGTGGTLLWVLPVLKREVSGSQYFGPRD
jgi:hypothetical protein